MCGVTHATRRGRSFHENSGISGQASAEAKTSHVETGLVAGALEEAALDNIDYDAMTKGAGQGSQPVANVDACEDMSEPAPAPQRGTDGCKFKTCARQLVLK